MHSTYQTRSARRERRDDTSDDLAASSAVGSTSLSRSCRCVKSCRGVRCALYEHRNVVTYCWYAVGSSAAAAAAAAAAGATSACEPTADDGSTDDERRRPP